MFAWNVKIIQNEVRRGFPLLVFLATGVLGVLVGRSLETGVQYVLGLNDSVRDFTINHTVIRAPEPERLAADVAPPTALSSGEESNHLLSLSRHLMSAHLRRVQARQEYEEILGRLDEVASSIEFEKQETERLLGSEPSSREDRREFVFAAQGHLRSGAVRRLFGLGAEIESLLVYSPARNRTRLRRQLYRARETGRLFVLPLRDYFSIRNGYIPWSEAGLFASGRNASDPPFVFRLRSFSHFNYSYPLIHASRFETRRPDPVVLFPGAFIT